MITKQQLLEACLTSEPINNYNNYTRFVNYLKGAESYAVAKFKAEYAINKNIRYLKIELDGEYPKEFIKEAVDNYRKSWKKVTFGIIDKTPGSYEPTHKWIIKIDTKE